MAKSKTVVTKGLEVEVVDKATENAKKNGFSSLQEAVRMFIHSYAEGEINFRPMPVVQASPELVAAIGEAREQVKRGDTFDYNGSTEDLIRQYEEKYGTDDEELLEEGEEDNEK